MSREYKMDKEYSFQEIIRYNLRKWWLAVILALLCAAALGGYKYTTLHQYVENEMYENKHQVKGSLFVSAYSDSSVAERAGNVMNISKSSRAYEKFAKITGLSITRDEYMNLFEVEQGSVAGVVSVYVTYPATVGNATLANEEIAMGFTEGVMEATIKTCEEMIEEGCVTVLDAPYATSEILKIATYSITKEDFNKAIFKAVTAGILLGIIVEIVLYTFWMLLYKKPKNTEEIRECLDANIIDVLKSGADNEDAFKKVALYLKDDAKACNRIACIPVQCPKKDVALKLAMSYANEQKRTLYVDLAVAEVNGDEAHSISAYILGEAECAQPLQMNAYLDSVCRNQSAERGMDIAGNKKFAAFIEEMSERYECIVINSEDVSQSAEAYAAAKLCNKSFVACGRKTVKNESLYRAKNTANVNDIHIDGVLVYEL